MHGVFDPQGHLQLKSELMLTNKNKLKKQKDVTTKCTSMRSGVLFSGVVDESVCAIKTFFFFFNHPSRTSEIKESAF